MKDKSKINVNFKENYYEADYFIKSKKIATSCGQDKIVTMQWFQRQNNVVVAGLKYIYELIRQLPNYKDLKIEALADGDIVNAMEPVIKISGKYSQFIYLEGSIDGILTRGCTIATNAKKLIEVANDKTLFLMNDRNDLFVNQQFDGYAAYIGGAKKFCTKASIEWIDDSEIQEVNGTIPHSLIALYNGDLIQTLEDYHKIYPNNNLVALVDYNNNVIEDAIAVGKHFKNELYAVRVDTSSSLVDKSLQPLKEKGIEYHGVNPTLIKELRKKLDFNLLHHVKIIVSSGFDYEKIKEFELEKTPVDFYGVGGAIYNDKIQFTGDVVIVGGNDQAKAGRKNVINNNLKIIQL